MASATAELLV